VREQVNTRHLSTNINLQVQKLYLFSEPKDSLCFKFEEQEVKLVFLNLKVLAGFPSHTWFVLLIKAWVHLILTLKQVVDRLWSIYELRKPASSERIVWHTRDFLGAQLQPTKACIFILSVLPFK
jgi:hypothetical protein